MQSEQKHNAAMEIYKPNHVLYRWLLAGAVVISVMSAFIPQDNPLFSILIGIGSGGIASVIVAWLIDISTCKQNNEKIATTRRIVFSQLTSSIESGIQPFILQCFRLGLIPDFNVKKEWLEWMEVARDGARNNPGELKNFFIQCYVLADSIKEQSSIIIAQSASLLDSGAIDEDEKLDLTTIMNICEIHMQLKDVGASPESVDRCLREFAVMHTIIERIPVVCEINHKQLGSTLFQKFDDEMVKQLFRPQDNKD